MVLKIALTGGIGSGKSAATNYFAELGVPIIDADKIAHELLKPGTKAYKKVISYFGKTFLTPQKNLNRKKLREQIFFHKKDRLWLENLLHPKIIKTIEKATKKFKQPYCIVAIPLLFETKFKIDIDRILVIDSTQKLRIERVCKRDDTTIKQVQDIIRTQVKREIRLKQADDVIYNNSSLKHLKQQIKKLHRRYLNIS